ncbi:MFS family protein [Helicobacter mustelae]|nr:MFS family protein [Helicobacter mustelae]
MSFVGFVFAVFGLKTLNPARRELQKEQKFLISPFLWFLLISYALNAIGYLGHTLFWVDYLALDLHKSSMLAGASWAFFGIGSAFGALGSGMLESKIGLKNAHILVFLLKALSCFIAAYAREFFWLDVSVFLMGFTTTGNVALTNALALHIVGKEAFARASSILTLNFAIFQAVFSLLFTYLLSFLGYFWFFIICGAALVMSLVALLPIKDSRAL